SRALDLLHCLLELLLHTFGRQPTHMRCAALDRFERIRLDVEFEPRRKANRAQGSQPILTHPCVRIAYGTNQSAIEVGPTLERITQLIARWRVRHRVDREVPTRQVFVEGRAKLHLGVSSVGLDVPAEGGHLVQGADVIQYTDGSESNANGNRA